MKTASFLTPDETFIIFLYLNWIWRDSPNTELFLVHIFQYSNWIRRDTPYLSVFSPNTGKYGPEITPYLDNVHAVWTKKISKKCNHFDLQLKFTYQVIDCDRFCVSAIVVIVFYAVAIDQTQEIKWQWQECCPLEKHTLYTYDKSLLWCTW